MDVSNQTLKTVRLAMWGLVALALAVVGYVQFVAPQLERTIADGIGRGDYVLETTDGGTFTQDDLIGRPSGVFFGFTHCPEVCPTTLADITTWNAELFGEDVEPPMNWYFVTVDPERDTAEVLGDYVSWAPGVTGVTGSRAEIDKAITAFRSFARRVPGNEENYNIDHVATIMLFDDRGNLFEPIGYGEGFDRAVAKIQRLIES